MTTADRMSNSWDVLGHPQTRPESRVVEEGTHYKVLAHSDWCDSLSPSIVKWMTGVTDDFTDLAQSLKNREEAMSLHQWEVLGVRAS